jgi:hypothetical protein
MKLTVNGKSIDLGEWFIDIMGTFAAFWIASKFFMQGDVTVAEQPIPFAVSLGLAFVAFKVLRQWKALS